MKRHEIKLFVMSGCQLCPRMEALFKKMHEKGAISSLEITDLAQHPEIAEQYAIRSVPWYFIDGVAFNGLKSEHDIEQLLQQDDSAKWQQILVEDLSSGQLAAAEKQVRAHNPARAAMMQLLAADDTALVVRIGLSAIIEALAGEGLLADYESRFVDLAHSDNPAIAQDAVYYLSLLNTDQGLQALKAIANDDSSLVHQQAEELLQEMAHETAAH